ncbi:MAG: prolyl oligopeptidase family serine peptidase [Thermoproteota archaeon]|nr:prolyl oligopeptidase family serine peptidase [Thermoproteota archaeon]
MIPTLSIIGNVSKSTGILLLNGENDSQTPVQQAFLLQQRLTEVNHPDHTLITYPNLGHVLYPSSQWSTGLGPIQQYVLADIYSWRIQIRLLLQVLLVQEEIKENQNQPG